MKIVALVAALGATAVAAVPGQSERPAAPKTGPALVLTSFKSQPAAKQNLLLPINAKQPVYIYKAPLATRPLKTW